MNFSYENILKLFGNEAAESESPERLKQYYLKSSIYDRVASDTPLRILVGHKGIGKSALMRVALSEDRQKGVVPILIRPDDISGLASENKTLLELIREWKEGFSRLLSVKILDSLDIYDNTQPNSISSVAGKMVSFLADSVKLVSEKVSLDPAKKLLIDKFLKTRKITVYLDDLDRGWEGRPLDIKRISALLNAVRDMSSDNPGLQFRVALRSDVYFLVRTADESTDKVEGSVVWYSWTNHEILVLLIKRIETFFGRQVDENALLRSRQHDIASYLDTVFEPRFTGRGHWENAPTYRVLMSLIRKRPRDLVKLCSAAAREAYSNRSSVIGTKHFEAVFEDYSQGRIQDAINEYRTELPELERLLMGMKPNKRERTARESFYFTTDQLLNKIGNVQQGGSFRFAKQQEATKQELAQFLYKINFLTARKDIESGEVQRKFFEENRYLSNRFADFGYAWEIHPAYRWALQPDAATQVSVRLSVDENNSANDLEGITP